MLQKRHQGIYTLLGLVFLFSSPLRADPNQPVSNPIDILYVTNRSPVLLDSGNRSYNAERSHSLAFGSVQIFGGEASQALVTEPTEIGRFPDTPYSLEKHSDHYIRSSDAIAEHLKARETFKGELSKRIANTSRKEVVIFIHGYNNSFDDAAKSTAQLCGDLGIDDFVCLAFTWPAGGTKGVLFGYNFDRESGEFSVPDLRKTIRMVADTKNVRKIHFIGHSRGSDVLASTIQQLGIEAYAQKTPLAKRFKIDNIIMAAPDIDIDVAYSRMRAITSDPDLPYGNAVNYRAPIYPEQIHPTVYTSSKDVALDTAKSLFGSDSRLGQLSVDNRGKPGMLYDKTIGNADFITVDDQTDIIGHGYFLSNLSVRRDIIATIKDHIKTGEAGRSLVKLKDNHWKLQD